MNPIASRPSAYAEPPDTWLWGQTLTLSDIVLILRRRLWLAIFPILFLLLPATGLIATTTPLYTAQSTVVVQPNPQQGVPPPREADALAQFQTEVNIITSERLARDAIHKAGLVNRPEFNPTLLEAREKPSILTPIGEAVADAVSALRSLITGGDGGEDGAASGDGEAEAGPDVVDAHVLPLFRERIQVFPLGTSRVIAIQFSSESPKTAAQVANVMAELYITQQIRAKLEAKQVATTWMTDSIAELRQNVEKSERAVEDYRARHGIVEGRNTTLVNDQISTVSSQLLTAKAAAEAAGAKVRGLEGMLSKDGPRAVLETAANPASGALRTQESTLRQRRAELSATYGPSHPLMINNSNEIAAIDGKLRSEATNVIAAARNEASVARQQVQALEASLIQFRAELNTLNQAEVELRALERDATANRTLLEQFLGQLRTKEATSVEQPDAYILSQASVPVEPAGPRRIFLVMGVGVLAGAVWLIMVVISELLDAGIKSSDEVRRLLEATPLGLLPRTPRMIGGPVARAAYVIERPKSAYAESLRNIHSSFLIEMQRGGGGHSALVTSSVADEGKTLLTLSLGRLVAAQGRPVLIIDADTRRPSLHRVIGSVHLGPPKTIAPGNPFAGLVEEDRRSGAHVITFPRLKAVDENLLEPHRLRELLVAAQRHYDLILVDAPPVIPVSDARLLAQAVDRCLFVVQWRKTRPRVARHAIDQLREAGANVTGVVVTQVDPKRNALYGYGDSAVTARSAYRYYSG